MAKGLIPINQVGTILAARRILQEEAQRERRRIYGQPWEMFSAEGPTSWYYDSKSFSTLEEAKAYRLQRITDFEDSLNF